MEGKRGFKHSGGFSDFLSGFLLVLLGILERVLKKDADLSIPAASCIFSAAAGIISVILCLWFSPERKFYVSMPAAFSQFI